MQTQKKYKITILGSGAFGTAIAHVASLNSANDVYLYCRKQEVANYINEHHKNPNYWNEKYQLLSNIKATANLEESLKDASFIIGCVPTQEIIPLLIQNKQLFTQQDIPFVSCSKGMLVKEKKFISQYINQALERKVKYCVLSGPSFAEGIMLGDPTLLVIAGEDDATNKFIQERISSNVVRLYTQNDVIGVEIAGAIKNIMAIGAGIIEGIGLGINSITGMLVRASYEMQLFAQFFGANPKTFFGLAGIGDLMLTGFGNQSRNRTCGVRLGKGEQIKDIIKTSKGVIEGIPTLEVVYQFSKSNNLDMPITQVIYEIVNEQITIDEAKKKLMLRNLTPEFPTTFHIN